MKRLTTDAGNVIVEFIGISVALLLPLSIIANSSILVAHAYLYTDIAARTAARAFVVSSDEVNGAKSANIAVGLAAQDFDFGKTSMNTKISCTKNPCLSPGGFVTVKVSKDVKLNLPRALGSRTVVVTAQHTSVVDELREP
ncbi:MAG: hypothetical protein EBU89_04230 [Actinobacteria bacterium]|nr:hypothetical protein [Actinomycetota bacterium]NBO35125.1 hypothetical protein [Actinomycetota bacterium]